MIVCKNTELIKANQKSIWNQITSEGCFSKLDSRIQAIQYPIRAGSAITLAEKSGDGSERTNIAKISILEPYSQLMWTGQIFPFGLLNFSETILLTEIKKNETEYTRTRELTGFFAIFMKLGEPEREQAKAMLATSMLELKNLLEFKG